jgi:uncharacterized protein
MSIREQLQTDLKNAMRSKDTKRRDIIRGLQAAIKQKEIDTQTTLEDDDILKVLQAEAKKRNESIEAYQAAERTDMAAEEAAELEVIQSYLPRQLSREELTVIVRDVIAETGATSVKEMGKVMPVVMKRVQGQADGKVINEIVRAELG